MSCNVLVGEKERAPSVNLRGLALGSRTDASFMLTVRCRASGNAFWKVGRCAEEGCTYSLRHALVSSAK